MRRTVLRRRLLVAADVGDVMYHPPFSYKKRGSWQVMGEHATPSETRTLGALQHAGLIRRPMGQTMFHPRRVVLTPEGVKLLTGWQHQLMAEREER